jgi:hypothetical protein
VDPRNASVGAGLGEVSQKSQLSQAQSVGEWFLLVLGEGETTMTNVSSFLKMRVFGFPLLRFFGFRVLDIC